MASKIDPFAHLLGKIPDEKIAEMAGVKPATVANYRRDQGIDALDGQPDEDALAELQDATDDEDDQAEEAKAADESEGASEPEPAPEVPPVPGPFRIKVLRTVVREFKNAKGKTVKVRIPRSEFSGETARTLAAELPAGSWKQL